jgi:hypothetical protein
MGKLLEIKDNESWPPEKLAEYISEWIIKEGVKRCVIAGIDKELTFHFEDVWLTPNDMVFAASNIHHIAMHRAYKDVELE